MNRAAGQKLRVATTLAWEFWARDWRGLLLGVIAALLLPGSVVAVLLAGGKWEQERFIAQRILSGMAVYWITVLALGSIILLNLGKPRRRYTLPASSLLLVAVPMVCAMLTMFLQYVVVATILNTFLDLKWPIWGPGLMAAALLAWCHAVLWSTSNSLPLRCAIWLVSFMLPVIAAAWSMPIFDWVFVQDIHGFLPSVARREALLFAVAMLACVGVGSAGFAWLRHGSGVDLARIIGRLGDQLHFLRATPRAPFSSPESAQFWSEWMERGYVLPLGTTLLGTVALVLACYFHGASDAVGPIRFALVASPFFYLQLLAVGFFWGRRSPGFVFGDFKGSRPLSDGQIATAILKSATVALIVSALIWVTFLVLAALILILRRGKLGPFGLVLTSDIGQFLTALTFGAVVVWSLVGLVTSLAVAGRRVMRDALFFVSGSWVGGLLLQQCLPSNIGSDVATAYFKLWFVLCLVGCGIAFVVSSRRHLITAPALWLAALLVLVAFSTAHFLGPQRDWESELGLFCGCCLTPIPLAAAPLAVYFNRHR